MKRDPTPADRLARMAKSFEKNRSVLLDDYNFFTPRAPTPPSTRRRLCPATG